MLRSCVLSVAILAACVTTSQPSATLYYLTPEAINQTGAHDLYDAIEILRPRWLAPCVTVFRNRAEFGGLESLREMGPRDVAKVRYIPAGHPRPGAGSAALATCPAIQIDTAR